MLIQHCIWNFGCKHAWENEYNHKVYAMEKGEFGEKDELMQRLSRSEQECTKLSEEVARLGDAERRYQVRILYFWIWLIDFMS